MAVAAAPGNSAWRAGLALILVLAVPPTVVFGLLLGFGALQWPPALFGWAICLVAAAACGLVIGRDVTKLKWLVHGLRLSQALPEETVLLVPGLHALGAETVALVRTERAQRERLMETAAADRALVERLPDPTAEAERDRRCDLAQRQRRLGLRLRDRGIAAPPGIAGGAE